MPHIDLDKVKLYYELSGQGPPLVLITGYGCDHSFWKDLLEFLSLDFQVLVFDHRGSGQTRVYSGISIEALGDDAIALIKALDLKQPCILGHSMGGAISLYMAAKYPEMISKLMIFNASAKLSAVASKALNGLLALQKTGAPLDLVIDCFMPWVFSENFLKESYNIVLYKRIMSEYPFIQTIEGNQQQLQALEIFDARSLLKNIKMKCLVVGTDRDLLVSVSELKYIVENIQNATLEIMPGGHVMLIEQPEIYAQLISKFLKEK